MTEYNKKARTEPNKKKKGKDQPEDLVEKSAPTSNIKTGDISGVSGTVNIAGGDIYTQLTPLQIEQQYMEDGRAKLKSALLKKRADLTAASHKQTEHKFDGTALEVGEGNYLVGRTPLVECIPPMFSDHQTVVMSGASGIGKTSLLQAGLMPALLAQRYLPILVDVHKVDFKKQSLKDAITLEIMSDVPTTPYLTPLPLKKFLEEATGCLKSDETLLLVLDGLEKTSTSTEVLEEFVAQWGDSRGNPTLKWLLSVDSGFPVIVNSFPDGEQIELPPLDRNAAAQAINAIENTSGELGEQNLKEILDGLESHHAAEEDAKINPTELQIVLGALTQGSKDKPLSLKYEECKGFNGIFEKYLIRVIQTKFTPEQRLIVREILTILEDRYQTVVPLDWLQSRVKSARYKSDDVPGFLADLRNSRILTVHDYAYELSSIHIKRAVRTWLDQQSLLDQADAESKKQLDRIRTSALRGLIGGAVGLVIFRWMVGTLVSNPVAVIFYSLLYGAIGGTVGLLLTFMIDVFIARNGIQRNRQRYVLSSATAAIMFAIALSIFVYLGEDLGENPLLKLLQAAIVGGAWGTVTGLGIAWPLGFARIPLWSIPATALLGSVTLDLFNRLFHVLTKKTDPWILAGSFVFLLLIVAVVLYRKYTEPI